MRCIVQVDSDSDSAEVHAHDVHAEVPIALTTLVYVHSTIAEHTRHTACV